ncbi:MAG: hypothetical protein NZ853_05125 [Leptospiraceae bacterium]|nr:hypothetical protein [Leptospiraceae bacterium]MDW7976671.1 hypothetical protein [Leptospiraceae bacterium]
MLVFVFGTFLTLLEFELFLHKKNYEFLIHRSMNTSNRVFAKIETIQNKSFFGYEHYYFTLSFWFQGKKQFQNKKVSSSLYYRYKEGDQIEAIVIKDLFENPKIFLIPQIFSEIELDRAKYKNLSEISWILIAIGILFLLISFVVKS